MSEKRRVGEEEGNGNLATKKSKTESGDIEDLVNMDTEDKKDEIKDLVNMDTEDKKDEIVVEEASQQKDENPSGEKESDEDLQNEVLKSKSPLRRLNPFYTGAKTAINNVKSELDVAVDAVCSLEENADDHLSQEALQCLHKAAKCLNQASKLVDKSRMRQTKPSLATLPDVALKHLLLFIPFDQQPDLRLLNKSMYQTLTALDVRYRRIKVDLKSEFDVIPKIILPCLSANTELILSGLHYDDSIVKFIEMYNMYIKGIVTKPLDLLEMHHYVAKLDCLKYFELNDHIVTSSQYYIHSILIREDEQTHLKDNTCLLDIHAETLTTLILNTTNMKDLAFNNKMDKLERIEITGSFVKPMIKSCNVSTLKLERCHGDVGGMIASFSNNLTTLQLGRMNITDLSVDDSCKVLDNTPLNNLASLQVSGGGGYNNRSTDHDCYLLNKLLPNSPKLKKLKLIGLDLSFLSQLTDELAYLERLEVICCKDKENDDDGLNKLASLTTNLQYLYIAADNHTGLMHIIANNKGNLEEIHIVLGESHKTMDPWTTFNCKMNKVKKVELHYSSTEFSGAAKLLQSCASTLQVLKLHGGANLHIPFIKFNSLKRLALNSFPYDDHGIICLNLVDYCHESLEVLEISAKNVEDLNHVDTDKSLNNLKKLTLSRARITCNTELDNLMTKCKTSLHTLTLNNVDFSGLDYMFEVKMESLKELRLDDCVRNKRIATSCYITWITAPLLGRLHNYCTNLDHLIIKVAKRDPSSQGLSAEQEIEEYCKELWKASDVSLAIHEEDEGVYDFVKTLKKLDLYPLPDVREIKIFQMRFPKLEMFSDGVPLPACSQEFKHV